MSDQTSSLSSSRPHYLLLDGLRGVAALIVVCYHIFEAFATSHVDQHFNHGYLAVDFFFVLSGFVMGYAYDGRWGKMSVGGFFRRRLIRLHPMVIMGALIGALMFYTQGGVTWDVASVSFWALMGGMLLNMLMIPAAPGVEVRGGGEMFPLNGPNWSLFFEYIGNILYALVLRRLSTRCLAFVVAVSWALLASFAFFGPYGDINAGFTLAGWDFPGGMLRLLYAYTMGLLLSRLFAAKAHGKSSSRVMLWSSLALLILLPMPRIGGYEHYWMNAVYEILIVGAVFPLIIWKGASGHVTGEKTKKCLTFLGDISYPLYMVHYPFIYLYYAWVKNHELTFPDSLPGALALVFGCILLAWLCLKFYDLPIRKRLSKTNKHI